ncbi:hypothetical protein GCM10023171_15730 [Microbacterium panaciterrae]|uniref:Uncharacterized protein n=1 Tax=Microbacterium panaciterrae TaxID=985759 RepID=A0ABP8PBY9_9MICO
MMVPPPRSIMPERTAPATGSIRLGTPSGVVTASAIAGPCPFEVREVSLFRTSRILMRGQVAA